VAERYPVGTQVVLIKSYQDTPMLVGKLATIRICGENFYGLEFGDDAECPRLHTLRGELSRCRGWFVPIEGYVRLAQELNLLEGWSFTDGFSLYPHEDWWYGDCYLTAEGTLKLSTCKDTVHCLLKSLCPPALRTDFKTKIDRTLFSMAKALRIWTQDAKVFADMIAPTIEGDTVAFTLSAPYTLKTKANKIAKLLAEVLDFPLEEVIYDV
jgi:hypothetical protein